MSFNEEAIRIARPKVEREHAEKLAAEKSATERAAMIRRLTHQGCVEQMTRWFDQVGMSPHPQVTVGEERFTYRSVGGGSDPDMYTVQVISATWLFEGKYYLADFDILGQVGEDTGIVLPRISSPSAKIQINGKWMPAGSKEAIGRALLIEQN